MWQSSRRTQEAVTHRLPKKPFVSGLRTASTTDHNDEHVRIAWMARESYEDYAEKLPPFSFQVYILTSAKATLQDPDFPAKFVDLVERFRCLRNDDAHAHFEFYRHSFNGMFACTDHQRAEVESRNRNAIWPRLVSRWTITRGGFHGFILVIDRDDWETNGLLGVDFDGPPNDGNSHVYVSGSEGFILQAERIYGTASLEDKLSMAWLRAGGPWNQSDLDRHNSGGFSPAHYPAMDPSAHYDVEHEDQDSLNTAPVTGELQSEVSDVDQPQASNSKITMRDLCKPGKDFSDLVSLTYEGHAGWETTSVWKASLSKARPPFSVSLYLASDLLCFSAEALFACIDRDLLRGTTWTLDIVRNVPDMQSALHHYSYEASRRSFAKTEKRRSCMRMLLKRICGSKLPEELLQLIEDILVPPVMPIYSASPHRVFRNMFLFLDASTQLTGPKIIYKDHVRDADTILAICEDGADPSIRPRKHRADEVLSLLIADMQSWRLITDEIHTAWSLSTPRLGVSQADLPWFSVRLAFPSVYSLSEVAEPLHDSRPRATVSLTLHASNPITIANPHILFDELWNEGLLVRDATTLTELPVAMIGLPPLGEQRQICTWSEDPEIGGRVIDEERDNLQTFWPEKEATLPIEYSGYPRRSWWLARLDEGLLKDGVEYLVSLKKGLNISRWTYGSLPGLKGPYNLPPFPVYGENECRFTMEIPAPEIGPENFE